MNDSLAEAYLQWLEPQIRDEYGNPNRTYWDLLHMMFEKEFTWSVPHDDNRIADGLALRSEFCQYRRVPRTALDAAVGPCSFLEVLIAISQRMSFLAGGSAPGWAWQLLNNLELHRMADPLTRAKQRRVNHILDTCISRTYDPTGQGGFFPLIDADEDQTRIEIWYQMAAFIAEIHPEY